MVVLVVVLVLVVVGWTSSKNGSLCAVTREKISCIKERGWGVRWKVNTV